MAAMAVEAATRMSAAEAAAMAAEVATTAVWLRLRQHRGGLPWVVVGWLRWLRRVRRLGANAMGIGIGVVGIKPIAIRWVF